MLQGDFNTRGRLQSGRGKVINGACRFWVLHEAWQDGSHPCDSNNPRMLHSMQHDIVWICH